MSHVHFLFRSYPDCTLLDILFKNTKTFTKDVLKLKTLKKSRTPDNNDKIKINLELQLILNQLVLLNIKDPIVYGLLIEGYECTLYEMKLEREAEYISRVVESFYMPRDMNDIALLPRITSIFLTIKDKIDMTIKSINERQRGKSILEPFIRNGMGMPRPIKDPLSFSLDFNLSEYNLSANTPSISVTFVINTSKQANTYGFFPFVARYDDQARHPNLQGLPDVTLKTHTNESLLPN
ncbi:hypothetical protein BDF21DRAFT_493991 [Thamnidium elegans]|nr:hypothetical protein BDF21DRAFT_493991 [Thamnidium elegans]